MDAFIRKLSGGFKPLHANGDLYDNIFRYLTVLSRLFNDFLCTVFDTLHAHRARDHITNLFYQVGKIFFLSGTKSGIRCDAVNNSPGYSFLDLIEIGCV
jgi:hypothetical protein